MCEELFNMTQAHSKQVSLQDPRFHHKGSTSPTWEGRMNDGGTLELESGVRAEVVRALQKRGHKVHITSGPFGGYQAILKDPKTGVYHGASEMRKDGQAQGY